MAQVVHQNVVVFGDAIGIAHDAFVNFEETKDFNFESSLFANLSAHGVFEALTHLDDSAWQGPPAFERFVAAFDQQNAVTFNDECSDTEDRTLGILTANTATLP